MKNPPAGVWELGERRKKNGESITLGMGEEVKKKKIIHVRLKIIIQIKIKIK